MKYEGEAPKIEWSTTKSNAMPNWLRSIPNFESQSLKAFCNQFASCLAYWWGRPHANSLIIMGILFSSPLVSIRILGYNHELTVACNKHNLGGSLTGSMREVLHSRKPSREPYQATTQKGKRARELPRGGKIGEGSHVCRWCHSAADEETLGQKASMCSISLSSFIATGFVLSMSSRYWVQFHEVCKNRQT